MLKSLIYNFSLDIQSFRFACSLIVLFHEFDLVLRMTLNLTRSFKNQTFQKPAFERRRADPKNVAAIILGGGAGTQLFPLTSRRATPAVRSYFQSLLISSTEESRFLLSLLLL